MAPARRADPVKATKGKAKPTKAKAKAGETLRSRRFRVLAEEHRLAVLEALLEAPATVMSLRDRIGIEQSLLSHHLRVLREEGFVECHRDGKMMVYGLVPGVKTAGSKSLELGCCKITLR